MATVSLALLKSLEELAGLGHPDESVLQRHEQEAPRDGHSYSMLELRIQEKTHANVEVEPPLAPLVLSVAAAASPWSCLRLFHGNGTAQLHVSSKGGVVKELSGVVGVVLDHYMLHLFDGGLVDGIGRDIGRSKSPKRLVLLRSLEKWSEEGEDNGMEIYTVSTLEIELKEWSQCRFTGRLEC